MVCKGREEPAPQMCDPGVTAAPKNACSHLKGNVAPVPGDLHGQGLGLGY